MNEYLTIFKMLGDLGGIGILAAVLFWLMEKQRKAHGDERREWRKIAEDGHELTKEAVGTMTSLRTLIEERIPRQDNL
jgi:hypothetical protein